MFNYKKFFSKMYFRVPAMLFASLITYNKKIVFCQVNDEKKNFPIFTRREVMNHCTKDNRIWVTFRDGVYDVTDWMEVHPGGSEKIMMVAGGSLDAFWEMYSFHKKNEIYEVLEKYRIGNLDPKDIIDPSTLPDFEKLKTENMKRSPFLIRLQGFPFCAECPTSKLVENFYTPEQYFFVRNHNSVPINLNKDEYNFKVKNSLKNREIELNIEKLRKNYKNKTVETIIMCTGNRRSQMNKPQTPKGLSWNVGSIANGKWSGALVKDILQEIGINEENHKGLHLIVNGLDKDFQGCYYSISVPLELIFREDSEVLLAYEYNGADIPYEHGYPLRLILPGIVGVRNVKWIKSIEIDSHESTGNFQQRDYKIVHTQDLDKVDLTKIPPLMEHVVNSAIVIPENGSQINSDDKIKGWAIGHFGSKIKSVQVSFDSGETWNNIDNLKYNENERGKVFGWTLWECGIPPNIRGEVDIWVRAQDSDGNIQPVSCEEIWNFRGLMNNSIHKIKVNLL